MISQEDSLFEILIQKVKSYHPSKEVGDTIAKAYDMAKKAHINQKRKSGQPFIIHPLETAIILADLKCDKETIVAAMLHDVIEDTDVKEKDIEAVFNSEILFLVQGLTKLERLSTKLSSEQVQIDNIKKILFAMANDIRVILIKLADRLHNMRTLEFQSKNKQIKIARETLDIYAPIAGRLGIFVIQAELEDLALQYLEPTAYEKIREEITRIKAREEGELDKAAGQINERLFREEIEKRVYVFYDHVFNIHKRFISKGQQIQNIQEISEIRIEVSDILECYKVVGILHEMYKPVPGKFKDHIAVPKSNLYRALHTRLVSSSGLIIKVHIMTSEMGLINNYGILYSWKYKEDKSPHSSELKIREKLDWLKDILEWQLTEDDTKFMQLLKNDFNLYNEKMYCFTPKGKIIELPRDSVAIDFAYQIHSDIGNRMMSAKINNVSGKVDYKLKKGDVVEIVIADGNVEQPLELLNKVKTSKAKLKILQMYKTNVTPDSLTRGQFLFEQLCVKYKFEDKKKELLKTELCKRYKVNDWKILLSAIGRETLRPGNLLEYINALEMMADETLIRIKIKTLNNVGLLCKITDFIQKKQGDIKWLELNVNAREVITMDMKISICDFHENTVAEIEKELNRITSSQVEVTVRPGGDQLLS